MNKTPSFLFAVLLGALLSGCGTVSHPVATPFGESMKGYELYSWQDGNQWKFSLLVGTNREKTLDEIKSAEVVLSSVDELQSKLEEIPANQYITWSSKESLSFQPNAIIQQIEQICKAKGLILTIAS